MNSALKEVLVYLVGVSAIASVLVVVSVITAPRVSLVSSEPLPSTDVPPSADQAQEPHSPPSADTAPPSAGPAAPPSSGQPTAGSPPAGQPHPPSAATAATPPPPGPPGWHLHFSPGCEAEKTDTDGQGARVEVRRVADGNFANVKLVREDLQIQGGQAYVLSFRARADRPRLIALTWGDHQGYIGLHREFELGPEWEHYFVSFLAENPGVWGHIELEIGGLPIAVEVSGVELKSQPLPTELASAPAEAVPSATASPPGNSAPPDNTPPPGNPHSSDGNPPPAENAASAAPGPIVSPASTNPPPAPSPATTPAGPPASAPEDSLLERLVAVARLGASARLVPSPAAPEAVRIEVTRPIPGSPEAAQLVLPGLSVNAGSRYQVTFEARCDQPVNVRSRLRQDYLPYEPLGWDQTLAISPQWTTLQLEAIASRSGPARVTLDLGELAAPLDLRGLTFRGPGEPAPVTGATASIPSATPPAGGPPAPSPPAPTSAATPGPSTPPATVPAPSATAEAPAPAPENPSPTGAPATGLVLSTLEGAKATSQPGPDGSSLRVEIQDPGSRKPWAVQVVLRGLAVEAGQTLELSFRARANEPRPLGCVMSQDHDPWRGLSEYIVATVHESWQDYRYTLHTLGSESSARLYFDAGESPAAFELADVRLNLSGGRSLLAAAAADNQPAAPHSPAPAPAGPTAPSELPAAATPNPPAATTEQPPAGPAPAPAAASAAESAPAGSAAPPPEDLGLKLVTEPSAKAQLTAGSEPGAAKVLIESIGTGGKSWNVQVVERNVNLEVGRRYAVTFSARADAERTIACAVAQNHAPWQGLGLYREVQLTGQWQPLRLEFTASATDSAGRIYFDLGQATAAVELKEIRFVVP